MHIFVSTSWIRYQGYKLSLFKGLASYCKAETTFTFHFPILTLSSAFLSINNREMKSESGFSFAMASKPLWERKKKIKNTKMIKKYVKKAKMA